MSDNRRSKIVTEGVQRSPNRAMLRAVGFGDADFDKPIVGVANGHSTITPCNMGLGGLAARAEAALIRNCLAGLPGSWDRLYEAYHSRLLESIRRLAVRPTRSFPRK